MTVEPQYIMPGILLLLLFMAAVLYAGMWIERLSRNGRGFTDILMAVHRRIRPSTRE